MLPLLVLALPAAALVVLTCLWHLQQAWLPHCCDEVLQLLLVRLQQQGPLVMVCSCGCMWGPVPGVLGPQLTLTSSCASSAGT